MTRETRLRGCRPFHCDVRDSTGQDQTAQKALCARALWSSTRNPTRDPALGCAPWSDVYGMFTGDDAGTSFELELEVTQLETEGQKGNILGNYLIGRGTTQKHYYPMSKVTNACPVPLPRSLCNSFDASSTLHAQRPLRRSSCETCTTTAHVMMHWSIWYTRMTWVRCVPRQAYTAFFTGGDRLAECDDIDDAGNCQAGINLMLNNNAEGRFRLEAEVLLYLIHLNQPPRPTMMAVVPLPRGTAAAPRTRFQVRALQDTACVHAPDHLLENIVRFFLQARRAVVATIDPRACAPEIGRLALL